MGGDKSGKKMKVLYGQPELVSSRCKSLKDLVVQALGSTALTESEKKSQAHVFRRFLSNSTLFRVPKRVLIIGSHTPERQGNAYQCPILNPK